MWDERVTRDTGLKTSVHRGALGVLVELHIGIHLKCFIQSDLKLPRIINSGRIKYLLDNYIFVDNTTIAVGK